MVNKFGDKGQAPRGCAPPHVNPLKLTDMVTYSIQKEVFVNYVLQSVNVEHRDTNLTDALQVLDNISEMAHTLPELYKAKDKKVDEHGTKVTFYFESPLIIRYKIIKHTL